MIGDRARAILAERDVRVQGKIVGDSPIRERTVIPPRTFKRIRRAALALGVVCTIGPSCAPHAPQQSMLSPAATAAELGLVASALEDTAAGPFFAPERLAGAVALIRRIRREYPNTRDVAVIPAYASEWGAYPALQFRMPDSLCISLVDSPSERTPVYVDRWLAPPGTGIARFDRITEQMGGSTAVHIEGMRPDLCLATVYYRQPLNKPGVVRAYAALRPEIAMSPFQAINAGDGDRVRIEVGDSLWTVCMSAGWGDCLAGCINRHFWEFRYRPRTGRIEAVTDSGPPVPVRRDGD